MTFRISLQDHGLATLKLIVVTPACIHTTMRDINFVHVVRIIVCVHYH